MNWVNGVPPAVLLVDDRPANLLALRAVLEPLKCRQVSVTSGEEALKALLNDEFAVVILDVQMPGMDGFETAELIKGRERTRTVPIIFVTAISKERHHVFRGYGAGAVDYLFKPYDPGVLRSKVSVFLDLDAKSRAAAQSEAILRASFAAAPIGMARLDLDGRVTDSNRSLAVLLGSEPVDLRGRTLVSLTHPDDAAADDEHRRALLAGDVDGYERRVRLAAVSGEWIPCLLSVSVARPGAGMPNSIVVQVQDLRERLRAEQDREQYVREQAARSQAERASARLEALQRISDAALGTLAFEDLVGELLNRTADALAVDTATVALTEPDGSGRTYQVAGGVDAAASGKRWYSVVAAVEGAGADADGAAPVAGDTAASALTAPLRVDGESIGVLRVATLFTRSFTPDEQALLGLAADRFALGIQRARLFGREHGIAEELQRSLLPAELPEVDGMSLAARYFAAGAGSQVGGDWYDAVIQPEGRLLLIIGDVSGRGIAAASTMGQLRSGLRAYALDGHGPGALLERLNTFQLGLQIRGMTTVAVVSVDTASGDVRFARAGHPPPLIVDGRGRASWLDARVGPPLGAVDGAVYEEGTAALGPGATLVLYTDGLVELRTEPIDHGLARLEAATAAAPDDLDAMCDVILEQTLGNPAAEDDVTLLILRRAGDRRRRADWDGFRRRRTELAARQLSTGRWPHAPNRSARVQLPGGTMASAAARQVVDDTLREEASQAELADLRITVAEVVSNAVIHGGADEDDTLVVHLAASTEILRVEISGPGSEFDVREPSPHEVPGGFGLVIIDQLTSRWGLDFSDDVCVWLEVDRLAAAEPA